MINKLYTAGKMIMVTQFYILIFFLHKYMIFGTKCLGFYIMILNLMEYIFTRTRLQTLLIIKNLLQFRKINIIIIILINKYKEKKLINKKHKIIINIKI